MTRAGRIRLALLLWVILAIVVWNVIFDRVLVVEGRRYAHDAGTAFRAGQPYVRIDERMRPAIARGVRLASAASGAIVLVGFGAIALAARREGRA